MLGIPRAFVIELKNTFQTFRIRHSELAHLFILKVEKILIVRLLVKCFWLVAGARIWTRTPPTIDRTAHRRATVTRLMQFTTLSSIRKSGFV